MPKKPPEKKRSIVVGVKVDETTYKKIQYLAGADGVKNSTYIYNVILKHIQEKEPWITKELIDIAKEGNDG